MVHPHVLGNEIVYLVQPKHIGCKWTKETLIYRSSVWNQNGESVSLSLKKFFNWGEQPDLCYTPFSLTANGGCKLIEKIDGSLLLVSKYKNQVITRTRGTLDATKLKNGHEITLLRQKYSLAFESKTKDSETWTVTMAYEWVSPTQRIILDYGPEPDIYLVGVIWHDDYHYSSQESLDKVANEIGVKRPRRFEFGSIQEMLSAVEALKGQEGICVYCNYDQDIRKVKSAQYLALHKLKSELSSIDKVIDIWFLSGRLDFQAFMEYLGTNFDFELVSQCRGFVSRICEAYKEVQKIVQHMESFVEPLKTKSRKEAAMVIQAAYGPTNRGSFCFALLDGRKLDDEAYKKLLYQVLKK